VVVRRLGALKGTTDEASRLAVSWLAEAVKYLAQQVHRQHPDPDAAVAGGPDGAAVETLPSRLISAATRPRLNK
jgi:hypothetical protein